jgi:hypothetical protein
MISLISLISLDSNVRAPLVRAERLGKSVLRARSSQRNQGKMTKHE